MNRLLLKLKNQKNKIKDNLLVELFPKIINAFFYFGSSIIGLLISLITLPLYSSYLSAEDFGLIGYFGSIKGMLTPLFNLSLSSYILMIYFRNGEQKNKLILFNSLFFLSISNILLSVLVFGFGNYAFNKFEISYPFFPFSFFIILIAFFEPYKMFLLQQYRIRKEGGKYFLFATMVPLLNAGFSIFFIVVLKLGVIGRMGGMCASAVLTGLIYIYFLRNFTTPNFSFSKFKKALKVIFPLLLAGYAYIPIETIDKIVLERLNRPKELGLYSIGLQVSSFLLVAATSLFKAYEPDVFSFIISKKKKPLIKAITQYSIIISIGFIVFILFQDYIIYILTRGKFTAAIHYSNFLSVSKFLSSIGLIFNAILLAKQKVKLSANVIYISSLSSLVLYPLFIFLWKFEGALVARIVIPVIAIISSVFYIIKIKDE